ncbi:class II aldolase/adducin domain-containing protein [Colletotrichum fioriniae PJ7]|uniref:Class II aldolase/adducin domain-containing protein n=1 Tax=Colletotrichum fioriniae PJ7 TaxID=1445577 RepID=A0A010R942_9PEZI|nr:class II aldolase/adducin domain-containing protein [Colletotrichum fioriniae PJ7]
MSSSDGRKKTPLNAIVQGSTMEAMPTFPNIAEKRAFMLDHMAHAFHVFARRGYSEGMAGHISLRDPEFPDRFWLNPLGVHFALLTPSDMALVNEKGEVVGGNTSRPVNAAGFLIHSAIHKARPDVIAACHCHSRFGKAWSAFGRPFEMLNGDAAMFYGDAQAVLASYGGLVFEESLSDPVASALGLNGRGLIMQNHGLLTVGQSVDEAAYLFTLMERCCEIQLLVEAAAKNGLEKKCIDDATAKHTFETSSDSDSLYCEFQPEIQNEILLRGLTFRPESRGQ